MSFYIAKAQPIAALSGAKKVFANVKPVGFFHNSVEKAGHFTLIKVRFVESDDELSMRGEALVKAFAEDREKGLTPFLVIFQVSIV